MFSRGDEMSYTKRCLKICGIVLLIIIIGTFAILYIDSGGYPEFVEFSNKSGSSGEYAELLLPIKSSDEYFTEYNDYDTECVPCILDNHTCLKFSKDSEIARYNDSGYMSFSTHIKNAYTTADSSGKKLDYYVGIRYKTAKIAIVDKDGNIKSVTNEVNLVRHTLLGSPPSSVELIYENGRLTSDFFCPKESMPLYMTLMIFVLPALGLSFIAVTVTAIIDCAKGT